MHPAHLIFYTTIFVNIIVWLCKWRSIGVLHAQLSRIHELLSLQILMLIFSAMIFRRFSLFRLKNSKFGKLVNVLIAVFLFVAHGAWLCFYVYLPDNLHLSLISFICVSIYIHLSMFCVMFSVLEKGCDLVLPYHYFILRSRNFYTIVSLVLAVCFTIAGVIVTVKKPTVRRESVLIPGLLPDLDGFTIALITDVHIGPTVGIKRIEAIVDIVNSLNADVVTVVGDLVDGFISNLHERALPLSRLQSNYGKFFATGNHEYYHEDVDNWINFFRSFLNLTVLRNSNYLIRTSKTLIKENNESIVCVVGVDDVITERLFIPGHKMNASKAVESCPKKSIIVLLAHQPNAARKIINNLKRQIHLILSGHTHGGQFYIFWFFAYWQNAFLHGLYRDTTSGTQVFVSSGVNYWGPPVKMRNLCEIVFLTLHCDNEK